MRKNITILAIACAALTLVACGRNNVQHSETDTSYRVHFGSLGYVYVNVWTDPETGCQSYVTDDGFLSPRLNADGMQRCNVSPPVALIVPAE